MATGVQTTTSKTLATVRLFEGLAAANAAPTDVPLATPTAGRGFLLSQLEEAGYAWGRGSTFGLAGRDGMRFQHGFGVRIWSTDGPNDQYNPFARLWTYSLSSAMWSPMGVGAVDAAGYLNDGQRVDVTVAGTATIRFHQWIERLALADGIYLEMGTPNDAAQRLVAEIDLPIRAGA